MAQKLKTLFLVTFVAASMLWLLLPARATAADVVKQPSDCASGQVDKADNTKCVPLGNNCADGTTSEACLQKNPIVNDLNIIVGFLSGLVGVIVVGVIILGGIQYIAAGDKADAVSAAKKRIVNGVIALVAFLFVFAFLQWLIPGGLFK